MQNKSKVETFIGFAVKKRAVVTGSDGVSRLKRAFVLLVCRSGSQNAKKQAINAGARLKCPLIECAIPLEDILGKQNCKIAAITDKALADAILNNLNENFSVVSGGIVH